MLMKVLHSLKHSKFLSKPYDFMVSCIMVMHYNIGLYSKEDVYTGIIIYVYTIII